MPAGPIIPSRWRFALIFFVLASCQVLQSAQAIVPSITARYNRSCAVDSAGAPFCWGDNGGGALGNGAYILRSQPFPVVGLSSGVAGIATNAAAYHTCAITTAGAAYCWGQNSDGQLGNGTVLTSPAPVPVTGLSSGVMAVATGTYHTCALTTAGAVHCWGYGYSGQLGDGTTAGRSLMGPTVSGLGSAVTAITAGIEHTCALLRTGAVVCWGLNSFGQLGNGTTTNASLPVPVSGLSSGVVAIAAGFHHTCALTSAGTVRCWGNNEFGQLGDGTTTHRSLPVSVSGMGSGVASLSTGGYFSCAVSSGGGAACWGHNSDGQVGDGSFTNRSTPAAVTGLSSGIVRITSGWRHSCALMANGSSMCWGYNGHGQFGDGTLDSSSSPVPSSYLTVPVVAMAAGEVHTCAVTAAGGLLCWGGNADFQLGDDQPVGVSAPGPVTGLASGITAISTGFGFTCALNSAGAVLCWGEDGQGQLGFGFFSATTSLPVETGITSGATAITAGGHHGCALMNTGAVRCWGYNDYGQLGDGTTVWNSLPIPVTGLPSAVTAVSAGYLHTCALNPSGGVLCWGWNEYGQLGNGTTTDSSVPVAVSGLSGAKAISAGRWHNCAITATGGLVCWGYNGYAQLGNGTSTNSPVPVPVTGLSSGIASVSAGEFHTCAVTIAGGLLCWGYNAYGQLGDGTTEYRLEPIAVPGLSSGVAAVATGRYHTCALMTQGNVVCWGYNSTGGLGDGTFADRPKSVVVVRENAGGSLAANDWFLELKPAIPTVIPADKVPAYLADTSGNAATAVVGVNAKMKFRAQDAGKAIYIYGYVPSSRVKGNRAGKDGGCVLAQLTSSGVPEEASASGLRSYVSNVLGAQQQTVNVLDNVLATNVAGSTFCVGTGTSSTQSVEPSNSRCVATVPALNSSDPVCLPPEAAAANTPGALSGLWWNQNESGWGIHFTQRRNIVFAAWYTYDGAGNPKWYVASNCAMPAGTTGSTGTCNGSLYEVSGPAFFGTTFNSASVNVVTAGSLRVDFQNASNASMTYSANGQVRTVAITRQLFASGTAPPATDYTDLWWNPGESGWGMAITQQYNVMFLAWYVYDNAGRPVWYVASNCALSGNRCTGTLFRTTGPPLGPSFDSTRVQAFDAGTVSVNFTDANNATLSYTVNGVTASKAITRQLF